MLRSLVFLFLLVSGIISVLQAQTFNWNTYSAGGTSYTNGNMSVAVTSSGAYFQSGSPKYVAAGSNANHPSNGSSYCTAQGLMLAVDWPNITQTVTVTITFATPVCGPVTFNLYDINADFWDDGSTKWTYFTDKIDISATDASSAAIPAASITAAGCSNNYSVTGSARTITADYNDCQCGSNSVTITSATQVKTIVIKYYSGPATYGPTPTYPSWQYVVIGNITATAGPTTADAGNPQTICGTTGNFAGNTPSVGTGTWTLVSGAGSITTPSSPTSGFTGLGAGANVFQWTISNSCSSSSDQVTITGSASSTVADAGTDQNICGTTTTLAGNDPTPGTGAWTVISGSGAVTTPSAFNSGVTGLSTGANVFEWTITNSPCPVTSNQVTVNVTGTPTTATTGGNITVCSSSGTLSGNTPAIGTGTWTLVSGSGTPTTPSSPNSAVTGLGIGTNVFEWTISNSCGSSSSQMTIIRNADPTTATTTADQSICGNTATLGANTPTVGTGLWTLVSGAGNITSPSSPNSGVTALGVGPNVFQWTISNSPCPASSSQVTITGVTAPTVADAGTDQSVCISTASLSGNTPSSGTGVWTLVSGAGSITSPSSPTSGVTGLGAGANVFEWTISNNPCAASSSQVTISNSPVQLSTGTDQTISCAAISATLTASSTTGGVTYAWTGPSGATPAGTTPNDSTTVVNSAGTYTVTATLNGCSNTGTVNVSGSTVQPNISFPSDQVINCYNPSVVLDGGSTTPGVLFAWTGPNGSSPAGTTPNDSSTTVSVTGTYTLTVTDPSNGCSSSGNVSVAGNTAQPSINMGADQVLDCSATTVTIAGSSATFGAVYAWTGPTAGTTPTDTNNVVNVAGTYTLTVTNPANGCTNSGTVDVTASSSLPQLSVGADQSVTCAALTATLTASSTTAGVVFSWTGPSGATPAGTTPNDSTTVVNAPGTYTVTVTNPGNNCSSTNTVTVNSNTAAPDVSAGADQAISCNTLTAMLSGSSVTPNAAFSWTGPSAGAPAGTTPSDSITNVNAAGTYVLTVTDPLTGCKDSATVTVTNNNTPPNITMGADQTIDCANNPVTISGSSTTPNVSYSWAGAGTTPLDSITTVNTTGTYTLTVTDTINGCSISGTVDVVPSSSAPQLTTGAGQSITCNSSSVIISASSSTIGVIYAWTGPSGATPAGSTPDSSFTTVSAPGTYTVTVTDTIGGCSITGNVTVNTDTVPPAASVSGAAQIINCNNSSVNLTGSSITAGATYAWTGPVGTVPAGATPDSSSTLVSAPGTYTLTVTDPSNGCVNNSQQVIVSIDTLAPSASVNAVSNISCANTSSVLTATGNASYHYIWTNNSTGLPAGTTPAANTTTVSAAGSYQLTVTDTINGCTVNYPINVAADTISPVLNFANAGSLSCSTTSITLSLNSTGSNSVYAWSGPGSSLPAGTNPDSSSTNVSAPGVYVLVITDTLNGCSTTDTITVTETPHPQVSFTSDINTGESPLPVNFTNTSSTGFNSYLWEFGDETTSSEINATHTFQDSSVYTVMLIGYNSNPLCNDTAYETITVYPEYYLIIPNVFTPNDDDINELFEVRNNNLKELNIEIYNRWGQLMAIMEGPKSSWDGRTQAGSPVPDGVYYYLLTAKKIDSTTFSKQGYFHLIR